MQVYKYNVSLALKQIFEKHLFIQTNYSPYLIKLIKIKIKIKMMCCIVYMLEHLNMLCTFCEYALAAYNTNKQTTLRPERSDQNKAFAL